MSPRKKPATRIARNMTLSPRTEAVLETLAARTGIARGRIVDIALANLGACEACQGRGTCDGPMGADTETCLSCLGSRLVPGILT